MAEYQLNQNGNYNSVGGVEEPNIVHDKFYSEVLTPIDVVANILRNVKDINVAGITHKFQGDKLILSIHVYEFPSDQILKDMIGIMNEVIKWLKKRYKEETQKTLKLKQVGDSYDVIGSYLTNKKSQITYTLIFQFDKNKLDTRTNSRDDQGGYTDRDNDKIDFGVA